MSVVLEWNLLKKPANINNDQYFDNSVDPYQMELEGKGSKAYSWHASSILASASIRGSMCTYSYSPELRELLYMPEIYGKINLLIQSRFTSAYSLALYENCIRFKKLKHTGWIDSSVFRKLMGVSDSKYKKYKDFKKRVLDKAIEEINKLSDIYVTPELRRNFSQQTFFIRFFLRDNDAFQKVIIKNNNPGEDEEASRGEGDSKILQTLKNKFYLSEKQIKNLLGNYSIDYILSKIDLIQNSSSYRNKKIENIPAYFLAAIKDDFRYPGEVVAVGNKEDENKKAITVKAEEKLKLEYDKYVEKTIISMLENIDAKEKKAIDDAFQEKMINGPTKINFIVEKFKKLGIKDPIIKACYQDFILKNYGNLVRIINFNDFVKGVVPQQTNPVNDI